MRVLYVGRGSSGHDLRFADAWRRNGFDVEALAAGEMTPDDLSKRIRDYRPDLVQAGPVTNPAWKVVRVWDGPLIATSWSFDVLHEVGMDGAARIHAIESLERADLVFVDNAAPRRAAIALGAREAAIIEFPWGIESAWLAQERRERRPAARSVFLSTRRHEPIYRVADVIDAFAAAAVDRPLVELRLAGSGSLTSELAAKAQASGLGDRISFLGEVDADDLRAIYADADVYVSSSPIDGTSVSLLEAMACGVPVVVPRTESNAEWVTERTGFDYPTADVVALADLMRGLADPTDSRAREATARAVAAVELVRLRANWDATASRFGEFAARAVENHARRLDE
ncbi:MAG TPA: glycosyltransferase [Pseudolysinimonas sp.]